MKKIILIILLFILSLGINNLYSQSLKDTSVVDFKTIDKTVHDKINQYGAENVLVVVDIDNTILTGDTDWTVDVCTAVPQGYNIVGVYDIDGNMITTNNCVQAGVVGETKVIAFEVLDLPLLGRQQTPAGEALDPRLGQTVVVGLHSTSSASAPHYPEARGAAPDRQEDVLPSTRRSAGSRRAPFVAMPSPP